MKKVLALLLTFVLVIGCLGACSSSDDKKDDTKAPAADTKTDSSAADTKTDDTAKSADTAADTKADTPAPASGDRITLEVYDAAANYQGLQTGWFQKVVNDRFNLDLDIIAPQVAGDAIYQARSSAGNLGDIIILDPTDYQDCIAAGLIKDITNEIQGCSNLMEYKTQIDVYNKGLPNNEDGKIYGIPLEMTNTSPTTLSEDVIYSSPMLRWDLYNGIGAPEIKDLDGLLDTLKQMMDTYPTNDAGDLAYPLSLWADWDGGDGMLGIANVVQLTTWYGEKIKGSAILDEATHKFTPITDKNASYYKILKFLYKANQMGLVDPDSATQDWNSACAKMSAGQVYLFWYSWQVGFWNTADRLNDGSAFIFTPVQDQVYYADSDKYFGSGRIIGIGSQVDDAKLQRIMDFLDWYASPEGCTFQHAGIEGFNYTVNADGTYTAINDNALMDNLPVPEEYGGAGYQDGNNQINQWIVGSISTNPKTGESYAKAYWKSYKEATNGKTKIEWAEKFGAAEPVEWMKKNNKILISPSVSVSLPSDSADISIYRNQCNQELCDASWRMIYAADDADFDAQWDELCATLDSYHFQELYDFDVAKAQIEVDAKLEAAK